VALGYTNAYEPRNLLKRFDRYVEEHGGTFTKQAIEQTRRKMKSKNDIQTLLCAYVYFSQPGGSPEQFIRDLGKADKLPGKIKGAKGGVLFKQELNIEKISDDATVTVWQEKEKSQYHYTVSRTGPGSPWRLDKAWRTGEGGKVVEEFSLPAP